MTLKTKIWTHGLASAVILGVCHSVSVLIVAPESFNFHTGFVKLLEVSLASGIIGAATYLTKSPLPPIEE